MSTESCTPSADAFAPGKDMLRTAEALERLTAAVAPVDGTEVVGLTAALNRVLAADVVAARAVPPHDNAAVDGYAVYHADLAADGDVTLPVTGRIAAGHVLDRPAVRGEALRIFTGSPVPPGPDTILPQEVCAAHDDGTVTLPPVKAGANLRKAGEDIRPGDVILPAGRRLRPQDIGLAASIGVGGLTVRRRVRVAVFSTGDEVRDPVAGQDAGPGAIYDSNRFVLMGLLRTLGAEVVDLGIVRDEADAVRGTLARGGAEADLIVTSGGVSTGDTDHVKGAVEALGALTFWRIAIRPGRPLAFGHVAGTPFVGLPGNPVASMLTFMIFARPLLLRLMGAEDKAPLTFPAVADFSFKKRVGRREWLRASLRRDDAGRLIVSRYPREGSGILTSMVVSDGLAELPEDLPAVEPGTVLDILPFSELLS
ncbi:gephyrin-like molybdotransferase Glp [Novispirillum sp. DQ9]|uniref:molybdopterin molybdotransferase MoeA n=1 Tax=Novispirillum sp. DQ9 TaxID=3398612 RepID=UPI003C7CDC08